MRCHPSVPSGALSPQDGNAGSALKIAATIRRGIVILSQAKDPRSYFLCLPLEHHSMIVCDGFLMGFN
jgi:hypothetical protein